MRLLDEDSDRKLDRVTVYLTRREAEELRGDVDKMLADPKEHHAHISSEDFQKELTICIYDETRLNDFNDRSRKLIKEGM